MLNFIKSEYYRMIHTTGIRVFFGENVKLFL